MAASSTNRSFCPFLGITNFTFWPRRFVSHWPTSPISSNSCWTHTSLGINGVPA